MPILGKMLLNCDHYSATILWVPVSAHDTDTARRDSITGYNFGQSSIEPTSEFTFQPLFMINLPEIGHFGACKKDQVNSNEIIYPLISILYFPTLQRNWNLSRKNARTNFRNINKSPARKFTDTPDLALPMLWVWCCQSLIVFKMLNYIWDS